MSRNRVNFQFRKFFNPDEDKNTVKVIRSQPEEQPEEIIAFEKEVFEEEYETIAEVFYDAHIKENALSIKKFFWLKTILLTIGVVTFTIALLIDGHHPKFPKHLNTGIKLVSIITIIGGSISGYRASEKIDYLADAVSEMEEEDDA